MSTEYGRLRVSRKHPVKKLGSLAFTQLREDTKNPTRQMRRALAREIVFVEMNRQYGQELRRPRRGMAIRRAARVWRQLRWPL